MLRSLATLWPYMRRYRKGLSLGIASLLMKDALAAALPIVIKYGVDSLTRGFVLRVVLQLAALLISLSLVKGLFQYWMRVIIIGISRDIEFDLRNDLVPHLVDAIAGFLRRYRTGDIMARSHQRSECGSHDARPGHHVLHRNYLHCSCFRSR